MSIEDGIRASTSAGASNGKTIHTLGKTNYIAWLDIIQVDLLTYELWDLVTGDRTRSVIQTTIHNTAGIAAPNQAIETKDLKDYMKDFRTSSKIIPNSISDEQMAYIKSVITNPVAVWKRLKNKFERKTEVAKEATHSSKDMFAMSID